MDDGAILRLVGKWLKAGVIEEDRLEYPDKGTPQGGLCKALLKPPYEYLLVMQSRSL